MVCGPSLLVEREKVYPLDQNHIAGALEVTEAGTTRNPGDMKPSDDDGTVKKIPTLRGISGVMQ